MMLHAPNIEFAPAKINLSLSVLGKRDDGYHNLTSLVGFVDIGDELKAVPNETGDMTLEISGAFAPDLSAGEDNLIIQAARLLQSQAGVKQGADLSLIKNLPLMAGLGGGSADAAACLRLLNRLWAVHWEEEKLITLAAALGADVPVCIASQLSWLSGRGEIVTKLTPPQGYEKCFALLLNPGFAISTHAVFEKFKAVPSELSPPPPFNTLDNMCVYMRVAGNDLTSAACALHPALRRVLNILPMEGALYSGLSGSGASCFVLFNNKQAAQAAQVQIRAVQPNYWVALGALR